MKFALSLFHEPMSSSPNGSFPAECLESPDEFIELRLSWERHSSPSKRIQVHFIENWNVSISVLDLQNEPL